MDTERKENLLKLMRFWLFGTFIIVFASVTTYAGGAVGIGIPIFRELNYWLIMILTAGACMVTYMTYRWYLSRQ